MLLKCSDADWNRYYDSYLAERRKHEPEGPVVTGDAEIDELDREMYNRYVLGVSDG